MPARRHATTSTNPTRDLAPPAERGGSGARRARAAPPSRGALGSETVRERARMKGAASGATRSAHSSAVGSSSVEVAASERDGSTQSLTNATRVPLTTALLDAGEQRLGDREMPLLDLVLRSGDEARDRQPAVQTKPANSDAEAQKRDACSDAAAQEQ